jgi:hypothetical protein
VSPDGTSKAGALTASNYIDGKRWWITGANLWDINTAKHLIPGNFYHSCCSHAFLSAAPGAER